MIRPIAYSFSAYKLPYTTKANPDDLNREDSATREHLYRSAEIGEADHGAYENLHEIEVPPVRK